MIKLPEPAKRPTMYFVGVTTGQSSIMKMFPIWAKELGLDAEIKGIDLPIHAPAEDYRAVVQFFRDDPLSLGALVTTHKIDMYNAAKDMFDYLDPYAQRFGELSSISKLDGQLRAHAKDPISSGLALDAFVPEGHWLKTGAEVCIIGAGGSALSISAYLGNEERHGKDLPSRIHLNNRSAPRLAEGVRILEYLNVPMSYHLCKTPELNDRIVEALPAGSLVIDGNKLPEIVPSTTVAGEVTPWAAGQTGLKAGTPVVMGGGDGLCSNVGAGSISPGRTFSCIGTSAWVATTSEKPLFDEEMRTFTWAHIVPGLYSPTGTMQAGGSSYNWLKGQVAKYETAVAKVQGISPYDLINAEAAKSPAGANGVLFLPYLLGERAPRWNPDATAAWLGLKMENQRCDLFRAVLEGVTLNLNIILESFRKSIPIDELLVVGGGAKGALWCQMMADVYNARIKVPVLLEEATSMGAAVTGGVGVGVFKGFEVIDQMLELNRTVEPNPEAVAAYGPVKEAFEVCYKAMLPVYEYMASHKNV